ncbi:MAG: nucleoside recognition domain-containing protein [Betaproteobacteria bacterium]
MKATFDNNCEQCHGCRGACGSPPPVALATAHASTNGHAWLDRFFLHPRWGLVGSLLVFAAVLFLVFEVSAWLDAMTTARLAEAASAWHPTSTTGVVARGVVDGLIGLVGIVVPYMVPLMLLLVALEQAGIMQRIALVIDRVFHRIGLHGRVAVVFLTGLGCNVPAISAAARLTNRRERMTASLLITLVPCSARSAIILALAGKYLGAAGVFAIFASAMVLIAGLGRLLSHRGREVDPFQAHGVPPYAIPHWRALLAETWERSRDVLTVVLPLLVVGSVVLALLSHFGADRFVNAALMPVTTWWLGLPIALGVPLLFGVLRKELSLLMIYQALGTLDVGHLLDATQLVTLLLFLTFYVPCLSTFAMMSRTLGTKGALQSVALSIGIALAASGAARAIMTGFGYFAGWLA